MSNLSYRLSMAVASGRSLRPRTREAVLAALLAKRSAAQRAGLVRQERMLRNQILWSLPVRRCEEAAGVSPD